MSPESLLEKILDCSIYESTHYEICHQAARDNGTGDQILKLVFEGRVNLVSNWFGRFGKFTATLESPMAGIGVFFSWDTGP